MCSTTLVSKASISSLGMPLRPRLNSLRQSGHILKPDIVVFGLSYGNSLTIENLGPQFVQLING